MCCANRLAACTVCWPLVSSIPEVRSPHEYTYLADVERRGSIGRRRVQQQFGRRGRLRLQRAWARGRGRLRGLQGRGRHEHGLPGRVRAQRQERGRRRGERAWVGVYGRSMGPAGIAIMGEAGADGKGVSGDGTGALGASTSGAGVSAVSVAGEAVHAETDSPALAGVAVFHNNPAWDRRRGLCQEGGDGRACRVLRRRRDDHAPPVCRPGCLLHRRRPRLAQQFASWASWTPIPAASWCSPATIRCASATSPMTGAWPGSPLRRRELPPGAGARPSRRCRPQAPRADREGVVQGRRRERADRARRPAAPARRPRGTPCAPRTRRGRSARWSARPSPPCPPAAG